MLKKSCLVVVFNFILLALYSQVSELNLQDTSQWRIVNRSAALINEPGKNGISFNEAPGNGLMILKGLDFSNGTIELDIKGTNKPQQSFVGFAFHGQDVNIYDAVYFRPFNFKSQDEVRRSHSVQYISMPGNDWETLRNKFPGKFENKIATPPGGDDWFHVKISVKGKQVLVFVNNEVNASLQVEKLNDNNSGGFAIWMGNNSSGSFANLKITKDDGGEN